MPESPQSLAERLVTEGAKVVANFASLADEQWQAEVYTEDTVWTVREVLSHFVTAERGLLKLFRSILSGGAGANIDFDIDRYNARQQEKTSALAPGEILDQFKSIRKETVDWVYTLSARDLERTGRHPFLGEATLAEMIKMIYLHNQIHYRDIRKALR